MSALGASDHELSAHIVTADRKTPPECPQQLTKASQQATKRIILSFRDSRRGSRSREPRSLYQCAYLGIISPSDPGVEQDMESQAHVPSLTGSLGKEGLDERCGPIQRGDVKLRGG